MRKTFLDSDSDYDSDDDKVPIKYKIIVIGDNKVGKTSLINRLQSNSFTIQYTKTKTIEIHDRILLGDILVDIWDVPPNICKYYNVSTLESDVILLMFDSNKTLLTGVKLLTGLHNALYKDKLPELWFVNRGSEKIETEHCHPDRIFNVDSMSRDGILDLIYDIRCKLLRKSQLFS